MKATNKPELKHEVRVLKTATCPSLSGKSKLTYQIGAQENDQGVCTPKSEVQLRIYANSGKGFFSDNWVPLTAIQQLLDKTKLITSFSIFPLIRGKSVNTAGFLLAALKNEGLVRDSKENRRCYERGDPKAFLTGVKTLLDSPAATKVRPQKTEATESKPVKLDSKAVKSDLKAQCIEAKKVPTVAAKKIPLKSSAKKKS